MVQVQYQGKVRYKLYLTSVASLERTLVRVEVLELQQANVAEGSDGVVR